MPLFRAGMPGLFLSLSAVTSVASGAVIPFDLEDWSEQWPDWSAAGAVVPRTGTYLTMASWNQATAAASTTNTLGVRRNGATGEAQFRHLAGTASILGTITQLLRCDAGDVLSLYIVRSSGAAVNINPSGTYLRAVRVGPERWT